MCMVLQQVFCVVCKVDVMSIFIKIYVFEDFFVGCVCEFGGRVIGCEEVLVFVVVYDLQLIYLDEVVVNVLVLGGMLISGWQICVIVMWMMCDEYLLDFISQGLFGIDNLCWLKFVCYGDMLCVWMIVQEVCVSKSWLEIGLVCFIWEVFNQYDEQVMSMEGWGMFG